MGETNRPGRVAWRGLCLVCRAVLDFLYTLAVIVLFILVCIVAYVATIEELPAPTALIAALESAAEKQGLDLQMKGIRFKPNGRVSIDGITVRSRALGAEIAAAKRTSIKIDPALLMIGVVRLTEIEVSDASLTVPPVMSPTGLPETFANRISLALKKRWDTWELRFGKVNFYNAQVYASGRIRWEIAPAETPPNPVELLKSALPEIWKAKDVLESLSEPSVALQFDYKGPAERQGSVTATVSNGALPKGAKFEEAHFIATLDPDGLIEATLRAASATSGEQIKLNGIELSTGWDELPAMDRPWPLSASATISRADYDAGAASGFAASIRIDNPNATRINADLTLNGSPWRIRAQGDPEKLTGSVAAEGTIGQAIIDAIRPRIPEQFQGIIAHRNPAEIEVAAQFDGQLMPASAEARLIADQVEIAGARFDQAIALARIEGSQLDVNDLWLRSGMQRGWMSIAYNLDTRKRRFLIDGTFDPRTLDGWFQPWWSGFWENFEFPEEGFYVSMDSQAIFLKPETLRITGLGRGRDTMIRGKPMERMQMDFFIRLHYFDLYNVQVEREEGSISGQTQFALARDPRDGIEKMVALWIDAESSIDVMIGPEVLREVGKETASILEPYDYEIPPRLVAQAESRRVRDGYQFDTDIRIDTEHPISFFGYPFQSLAADVSVDNERIEIRDAEAGLAGGSLKARADIVDDAIELDASLEQAHFGDTLRATSIYFENNGDPPDPDFDRSKLHDYGGTINASFVGDGIVGDTLSYTGSGKFEIRDANFGQIQLFGLLSKALEGTPLQFTTLKFNDGVGSFLAKKRYLEFPDLRITGPIAQINSSGRYDLETESMDFKATFFPFRQSRMPVIALLGVVLEPLSHVMEVRLTGSLTDPEWRPFSSAPQATPTSPEGEPPPAP